MADPKAPRPSGAEIMMRSLGMGDVIEAAKALANAGTLEKILKFADDVAINNYLNGLIYEKLRQSDPSMPSLATVRAAALSGASPGFSGSEQPSSLRLVAPDAGSGAA